MIKVKNMVVPAFNQELFSLLYTNLGRPKSEFPNSNLFQIGLLPREILIHANSDSKWSLARINYEDGLSGVIAKKRDDKLNKHLGYTLYEGGKAIASVSGIVDQGRMHCTKQKLTKKIDQRLTLHLGSLGLLTDRYELMRRLDQGTREFDKFKQDSYGFRHLEESVLGVDQFLRVAIDNEIAYHARSLFNNLKKETTNKGEVTHLTLFDEDSIDQLEAWNHTLINIIYSQEIAEKIKLSLKD